MKKFLTKIFLPSKIAQLVQEINTFRQFKGENLVDAWERFHAPLRRCPHHRLTKWMQVHTFYNSLSDSARTIIDSSVGGALMKKTIDQTYEISEDTTTNTNQWPRGRSTSKKPSAEADIDISNLVNHVA